MPDARPTFSGAPDGSPAFATTHWSMVLAAAQGNEECARAALEALCRAYWQPIYCYVRREGHPPAEAQDLTQSFFARLVEHRAFEQARQERGRLRSLLLVSLKNFLTNEWRHQHAAKRGGHQVLVELDALDAEERYALEPADSLSADRIYERRWALDLLEQVMAKLEAEYDHAGNENLFAVLKPALLGDHDTRPQAELAQRLGTSENALKQALFRLRQRYRSLLRATVAGTVADPVDVEPELRHLVSVLRR